MKYRIHPNTAWVQDPTSETIHVMPLPAGEPMTIGGTGCVIYLDIVAGRDPLAEALLRWDAPEGEVRAGVESFLASLASAGVLVEDEHGHGGHGGRDFRLLFVCTANICRSAYADVRLRSRGLPGLDISSAGTHALVGQPVDPPMAAHLTDPTSGRAHVARQLTRELLDEADLVVAMSERHRDYILEEWPHAAKKTFLIGHVARELAALPTTARPGDVAPHLWAHRNLQPGDSVRDPYRRGHEVARETARIIDSHLDVIGEVLGRIMIGERA